MRRSATWRSHSRLHASTDSSPPGMSLCDRGRDRLQEKKEGTRKVKGSDSALASQEAAPATMVFGKLSADGRNLELSDGSLHPMAGFGTYKIGFVPASSNTAGQAGHAPDHDPKEIIKEAVAAGYRYIDCAQFYGNEKIVGAALAECGVPRRDLYIVSKVWGDQIYNGREAVLAQLDRTLEDLGIEHLDLYLLHWPVPGKHVAAYQVLEEALAADKIKAIGISNYTKEDYLEVAAVCKVKPLVNQIEMNPFLWRKNTYDFFMAQSIAIQSYRALRQAKEMENAALVSMAAKYGKTPAQVGWCSWNQNDCIHVHLPTVGCICVLRGDHLCLLCISVDGV